MDTATKLRFELRETPVRHPYFVRRNPVSGNLEPKIVVGRGVWDNDEQRWAVEPKMKKDGATHPHVRVMNGLPELTTQRVVAILRKAGHSIGKWLASGQIRGWGDYSAGALVKWDDFGRIHVHHVVGHWSKLNPAQLDQKTGEYAATLTAAGIPVARIGPDAVM
jgi:hypothetical protein